MAAKTSSYLLFRNTTLILQFHLSKRLGNSLFAQLSPDKDFFDVITLWYSYSKQADGSPDISGALSSVVGTPHAQVLSATLPPKPEYEGDKYRDYCGRNRKAVVPKTTKPLQNSIT